MAQQTIRLRGYKETMRALNKIEKGLAKEIRDALKKAAEPVAQSARSKLSRYRGASVRTIGPRATARGVFVTQRARKVTGHHPHFGVLQMEEVLVPALEENEREVLEGVEDAIDRLGRGAGF